MSADLFVCAVDWPTEKVYTISVNEKRRLFFRDS